MQHFKFSNMVTLIKRTCATLYSWFLHADNALSKNCRPCFFLDTKRAKQGHETMKDIYSRLPWLVRINWPPPLKKLVNTDFVKTITQGADGLESDSQALRDQRFTHRKVADIRKLPVLKERKRGKNDPSPRNERQIPAPHQIMTWSRDSTSKSQVPIMLLHQMKLAEQF